METRTVHAIQIHLRAVKELSVIIWPKHVTAKCCLHPVNPRRTWLTTRAGDHVTLKNEGRSERYTVEKIELYRVNPADDIGRIVESGRAWLDGSQRG